MSKRSANRVWSCVMYATEQGDSHRAGRCASALNIGLGHRTTLAQDSLDVPPMVDLNSSLNSFELRRDRRFDLPTPEFPSKTTLKMAMSRREEGELMEGGAEGWRGLGSSCSKLQTQWVFRGQNKLNHERKPQSTSCSTHDGANDVWHGKKGMKL